MGAVTSSPRLSWLAFLLVTGIASAGGAQLIAPPPWWSSQRAEGTETRSVPEQPPRASKPPTKERASPEPSTRADEVPSEPPPAIAKPRPGAPPVEQSPPSEERNPLLALFLSLLGVGLALFVAERARSWITSNIPLRRVLGALVFILRLVALGLLIAIIFAATSVGWNSEKGVVAIHVTDT